MAVEMADFVFAKHPAFRHHLEQTFARGGELLIVVQRGFDDFREQARRQKAAVFSEETKHDAIQETGNAEIFALGEIDLLARGGVGDLHALAFLQ